MYVFFLGLLSVNDNSSPSVPPQQKPYYQVIRRLEKMFKSCQKSNVCY